MIEPDQPVLVQRDAPYPVLVRDQAQVQQLRTVTTAPIALRDASAAPRVVVDGAQRGLARLPDMRPMPVLAGFAGPRGPQGPQGDPGGSSAIARPIGAVVQGLRIVRSEDGVIYPVDLAIEAHAGQVLGLGLQSVTVIGNPVNVQLAGPVTDSSWAWAPGPVWCGADGALTQAPTSTGWLMVVGRAIEPTTVDIAIEPPIYRG